MKKIIVAIVLFFSSWAANAVQVILIAHNQTSSSGTISTLITDGSHTSGISGPSTAVWDWDGTTLISTGLYAATSAISSSPVKLTVISDQITNLSIDTGTGTASATGYACIEGTFLSGVGASGCGGYNLGTNGINESTTTWGPGTSVSQTLSGDDLVIGNGPRNISAYDFGTVTVTEGGTILTIGNGIAVGSAGGEAMIFSLPATSVTITIGGGNSQECSEANGATVDLQAEIDTLPGDAVASVEWFLDTASIGFGENLSTHIPLGTHTIDVLVTTVLGNTSSASEDIDITDTTAPVINASFSKLSGNPNGFKRIQLNYDVTDVCDPDPSVSAITGVEVADGEKLGIHLQKGIVAIPDTKELILHITAMDTSGNMAEYKKVLPIAD